MAWRGDIAEWDVGDITYLSLAFSWQVREAWSRAVFKKAMGQRVIAGGPAFMDEGIRDILTGVAEVPTKRVFTRGHWRNVPADHPDGMVAQHHNPDATFASRGCPVNCSFCNVPVIEGDKFTLLPDFTPRPVLCDNNLSALPADYQDHIIRRYQEAGVKLTDANSGFEPITFTPDVYARWKPLINEGRGPWRFAYDETKEGPQVRQVLKMLAGEPTKRKRVYVLVGNEPYAECLARFKEVVSAGCEPHVQPVMKLNALDKGDKWVKHDWTALRLKKFGRWGSRPALWKSIPFEDYDQHFKEKEEECYDAQQGLFV